MDGTMKDYHNDEQQPLATPEELDKWLMDNREIDCVWLHYSAGVEHGRNYQHIRSHKVGYEAGQRDTRATDATRARAMAYGQPKAVKDFVELFFTP